MFPTYLYDWIPLPIAGTLWQQLHSHWLYLLFAVNPSIEVQSQINWTNYNTFMASIRAHMHWTEPKVYSHTDWPLWLSRNQREHRKISTKAVSPPPTCVVGENFDGQQIGIKLRSICLVTLWLLRALKAWPPQLLGTESWAHTHRNISTIRKQNNTLVTFHNELCYGTILLLFSCWSAPAHTQESVPLANSHRGATLKPHSKLWGR